VLRLPSSLKHQLVWIVSACTLGGLATMSLTNIFTARSHLLDNLDAQTHQLTRARVAVLSDWAQDKERIVQAALPAIDEADPLKTLQTLKTAGGLDNTYFGYADKRYIFANPAGLAPDYDPTARPWYKAAAQAGKPVLTAPYVDAGSKKLVVTSAVPVMADGQLKAVAAADIFLDRVVDTVSAIAPTPSSYAFLVHSSGQVIAHKDTQLAMKASTEVDAQLTMARIEALTQATHLTPMTVRDQSVLVSAAAVKGTDWTLVVALDRQEAMAGVWALVKTSVLASVVVLALTILVTGTLIAKRLRKLEQLRDTMREISSGDGDLSRRLETSGRDELAEIARSFNAFVEKLNTVLVELRNSSGSVHVAAQEIATGNQDLSQRTENTASNLQHTASSMSQLLVTVNHSTESARQANQMASSAAAVAERGTQVVSQAVSTMGEIHAASRKITDIISVIDGIAFQTNILALNAAVEAARAGEQGRGFAVVASEVRSLAQRSATAAREIKSLIEASVERVEDGTRYVNDAGATMSEIMSSVQRVSDVISEITASANEQSQGIEQVTSAVNQLDQMTQQNAALVEESAAAAESLKDQATRLSAMVQTFRLSEAHAQRSH
jgi:methyl-accepting chemotaxis protein